MRKGIMLKNTNCLDDIQASFRVNIPASWLGPIGKKNTFVKREKR